MKTPRIGYCWKGSPTHPNDRLRSIPDDVGMSLFTVGGVAWQSLQYKAEVPAHVLSCPAGDYADTARVVQSCELVITVDTSIAHLAASMGKETWVLLPVLAEWRWLQDRNDSPWYPSVRLFRQTTAGDWWEVLDHVRSELECFVTAKQIIEAA